jgi:Raf kinase inhibitor-like YbhB/YbcL family protein
MRILLGSAILGTSFLLLHCSSEDSDDKGPVAGSGGSASAGKGGAAGSPTAGKGGTGPTGSGGTGAAGGTGPTGSGGAGRGGTGPTGSGGAGAGGTGPTGSGGAGAGGTGLAGSGGAGAGGTGAGGAAGSSTASGGASGAGAGGTSGNGGSGGASAFTLTSTTFMDGGDFPDANTCAGADESPALSWTTGPTGTMSYAVVLLDTDNDLNHWAIWDIPASVTSLPAALSEMAMPPMPVGAKQRNFQGAGGYFGPCPSGMEHTYRFTVYALPVAMLTGTYSSTDAVVDAIEDAEPLADAALEGDSDASRP